MSAAAAEYYQERAERLGIAEVPAALNGEAVLLSGERRADHLSLQSPNPTTLQAVTDRYAQFIKPAEWFVLDAFRTIYTRIFRQPYHYRHASRTWLIAISPGYLRPTSSLLI